MFVIPYTTSPRTSVPVGFTRAVGRLFDESLSRSLAAGGATRTPAMDVHETDAAYIVSFELPGIAKEQVKVTVEGRRLVLQTTDAAVPEAAADAVAPRALYRERAEPRYARTVVLPAEVDASQAQARVDNGVLTLTLLKRVPTGATQVSIS